MIADLCSEALLRLRERAPLVHSLANFVSMNLNANALLALGATAVMAHAPEEVEDMVALSGALVINIGTLSTDWIESMALAMRKARLLAKPIVFDPVGVGATAFRTETALQLIQMAPPSVIRGNASEILALAQVGGAPKGVESTQGSETARHAALRLANEFDCTVCVTGHTDYIYSAQQTAALSHGHPVMTKVTGMGCTATALIGAFAAVSSSPFIAGVAGLMCMGLAGERAAVKASGPGSFEPYFLDELMHLTPDDLRLRTRLE